MNAIKINATFAAELEAIRAANKSPWIILDINDEARGPYNSRTEARADKAIDAIQGKIMKADEVTFEVVELVKEEPVTLGSPLTNPVEMSNQPAPEVAKKPKVKVEITSESTVERPCKLVYQIADEMLESRPGAKRKEVLAECVSRGIAYYTARTQYQQWLQVRKEMAEREAKQAK